MSEDSAVLTPKESLPRPARAASAKALEFPVYDPIEFAVDRIVHVLGVCFGVIGAVAVIVVAARYAGAVGIVATSLYAASLLAMVGFSAAYNLTPPSPARELLRRLDHATIFFLIAGTYSAIALGRVETAASQWLALIAWSIAIVGAVLKIMYPRRFERVAVAAYVALGLLVFVSLAPLISALSTAVLILVAVGSFLYVTGVVFHLWEQLRFQNAIWHALVLCAACCHYAAVVLNM
jgi:hemolysin III